MKYVSVALAIVGLSALAWSGVLLFRDRNVSPPTADAQQDQFVSGQSLGGPVSHGLQLQFAVVNPPNGAGLHSLRLTLQNVSDATVELKYRQSSYDDRDLMPYQDVMRNGVGFISFPEIAPDTPQTGAPPSDETFVDRVHRLLPGELVEVNWESDNERIGLPNESSRGYSRLTPCSTGLFLVRAVFDVETSDGGVLRLWSNECPFVVGGSLEPPKAHVARVWQRSQDNSTYSLNVGARDGVEIGDVYRKSANLEYHWEFTVKSVDERGAIAVISSPSARSGEPFVDMPSWSEDVVLQCPVSRASKWALSRKEAQAEYERGRKLPSRP